MRIAPLDREPRVIIREELSVDIAFGDRNEVTALEDLRDIVRNVRQVIHTMGFLLGSTFEPDRRSGALASNQAMQQ